MNNIIVKPRKFVFAVALVLLVITTFSINTGAVYAAPEDEWVSVEYRYTEGGTPNIPDSITQGGIEYSLISSASPVLESTLPIIRTYTYAIGGSVSPEQIASIEGMQNLVVTPVHIVREREVDKVYTQTQEHNEVEGMIPDKMNFDVTSATSASGFESKSLDRAGISWVSVDEDGDGLPDEYTATVLYRGLETFSELGYYSVEATYQTNVQEGSVRQYVVVATYEPLNPTIGPDSIATMTPIPIPLDAGDNSLINGDQEENAAGILQEEQSGLDAQTGNILQDIANGKVPLGNRNVDNAWSLASMLFAIASVILGLIVLLSNIANRKNSIINKEPASIVNFQKSFTRMLVFIISALTILTWLLFDHLLGSMVWINDYTLLVGLLFIINVAVFVIYSYMSRKKERDFVIDIKAAA